MRDTNTAKHSGLDHWLMLDLIERKIRLHTERLYEERGHAEGRKLEDWLKAASAILRTGILAPLWHSQHEDHAPSELSGPTSYDSGYEHSLEHWIELQRLVHEADDGFPPFALAGGAREEL